MSQSSEGGRNKTQSLEAPLIAINNSYDCINLVKSTVSHGRHGVYACVRACMCLCVCVFWGRGTAIRAWGDRIEMPCYSQWRLQQVHGPWIIDWICWCWMIVSPLCVVWVWTQSSLNMVKPHTGCFQSPKYQFWYTNWRQRHMPHTVKNTHHNTLLFFLLLPVQSKLQQ